MRGWIAIVEVLPAGGRLRVVDGCAGMPSNGQQ